MGIAIALILMAVGFIFSVMLDGQVFTNSVILISCCAAASFLCLWEISRSALAGWRRITAAVVGLACVIVLVGTGFKLPKAYVSQENFNKQTRTPICPEYKSSMCPYGWREALDENRGCIVRICTETPQVHQQQKKPDK